MTSPRPTPRPVARALPVPFTVRMPVRPPKFTRPAAVRRTLGPARRM